MSDYVRNKKAGFDFELLERFEAGAALLGTEVKSLRSGRGRLEGAHVVIRGGEAYLVGASIPPFQPGNTEKGYDLERPRKLLLSKKELLELSAESEKKGLTIIPIRWYNRNRSVKLEIAIARGKKKYDKREAIKQRESRRDQARLLKS